MFIIFLLFVPSRGIATEYVHILNDKCIRDLYELGVAYFKGTDVETIKDSRGIILRFWFPAIDEEYKNMRPETHQKMIAIQEFLAKIENPAIIEVHTGKFPENKYQGLKNWEISTVLANKLESVITEPYGKISRERVNSVGYGEFLPAKNPPNNGGKYSNRVDIIILCNVNGE